VKIKYESADADSEKAKKVTQNFLVSANSVKEAYERIKESLSTLLVDFEIPSIMVSPIVEIFPYAENLDKEISRTPIEKVEVEQEEEDDSSKVGGVFSASGSDVDDEGEESDEDEDESEIEDSTDED
jgi:type III secretion system FlhB-like substrate exporter